MIEFVYPEAFLLAIPVLLLLRRRFADRPLVGVLRLMMLGLVLALLAEPYLTSGQIGRDLILVIDRSRSIPQGAARRIKEVAEQAADMARKGDRIGVVSFGRSAAVETSQTESFRYDTPQATVDVDATDITSALDRAMALIPPGRQGSILLFSDGENTGADPTPSARAALRRGVRIDCVMLRRDGVADIAVEEVGVPGEVSVGEPFQFSAWVRCDKPSVVPFRLLRDGKVIRTGKRSLSAGLNRMLFFDRLIKQGLVRYEVELDIPGDRVPENDRAQAVMRVTGPARVLCVTPNGRSDRLTSALRGAGIELVVVSPELAPLSLSALDGFRAVILENVPAEDLPFGSLVALQQYVRDLGGGLLMTGGRASYGPGGYYQSPVEEVLPVSMEVRQEHRKFSMAIAIVLDRSGSMGAAAGGGTKMDLANLGTIAALELLGPADSASVIAVDSQAHIIVPMQTLDDPGAVMDKVRTIESQGGGIFMFTGLMAAAKQLAEAEQSTKHIVMFADAADAEEPGDYKTFVPDLVRSGVTVSVIGLGHDTDSDAAFLEDLALLGNGRCLYASDAADLPRVFAQETIQVARSSFADVPSGVEVLPDILAVGQLPLTGFPSVGGYSLAYLKRGAQAGLVTSDEIGAPLFSFWHHGLGRSAAYLGEADGDFTGEFAAWGKYTDFFVTVTRWLAGNVAQDRVFADLKRTGHQAILSVEVAEGDESSLGELEAVVVGPDGPETVWLRRVDDRRMEAVLPLKGTGVYRAAIKTSTNEIFRVPPITLPYSPEYEPRADPLEGEKLLGRLAKITMGRVDPPVGELLSGSRMSHGIRPFGWLCATILALILLLEITVRRLGLELPTKYLSERLEVLRQSKRQRATEAATALAVAGSSGSKGSEGSRSEGEGGESSAADGAKEIRMPRHAPGHGGRTAAQTESKPAEKKPPVEVPEPGGIASVLDRAKAKSKRRR